MALEPLTLRSRGMTYRAMPSLSFGGARWRMVFGVSIALLVVLSIQAAAAAARWGRQRRRTHC